MSWCSDAPEDEAISLFAGLLANPDVRLSLGMLLVPTSGALSLKVIHTKRAKE